MKQVKLYGEISKTEEMSDGTVKVWGYASSNSVDSDGEIITSDAMKAALPDYLKFGAVREMHQAKAAGTAIEAEVQDDGRTFFGAHIVDSEACKKVKANVYKGFSIGGKVTERDTLDKTIIKGLKLIEVSLVDRPANPDAVFTFYKADGVDVDDQEAAVDQLAEMLNKGEITPQELIALAKSSKASPTETTEKVVEVQKGMAHVAQLALLLKAITSLIQDQIAEAEREGDGSKVPGELQSWLEQGGKILQQMTTEETGELLTQSDDAQPNYNAPSSIYLAERAIGLLKADDLESVLVKAGAKFSAQTKVKLAAVHEAAQACCDHLDALGYKDKPNESQASQNSKKADGGADLEKLTSELDLVKAQAAKLADDLTKAQQEITDLKAKPAPGKALLMAISKGADALPEPTNEAAAKEAELESTLKGEALALHQIKKLFSQPAGRAVR